MVKLDTKWLVIAAFAVFIAVLITVKVLSDRGAESRQADADRQSAEAMQEAGQAAVATVLEQADEELEIADLVDRASKEIDDAPNPTAARAATLDAVCELRIYRDDPACSVREPDSPEVD